MKKFEYNEPEFKVVITSKNDVLTASQDPGPEPTPNYTFGAFEGPLTTL